VGPGGERLEQGVTVPDKILERTAAVVSPFGGPALRLIDNAVDPRHIGRAVLRYERDPPPRPGGKHPGYVPELGRIVLVEKQDVHADSLANWPNKGPPG